jgi:hypothetical protein
MPSAKARGHEAAKTRPESYAVGSAGWTGRGRPFCSNGARTYCARRRTGSCAGPPTPSHRYRRPTPRSSAVVAQKWMGKIPSGGSREAPEEIERTDAEQASLRRSVEMTAAAKNLSDPTVGRPRGSTQSERPKRGDRAIAFSLLKLRPTPSRKAGILSRDDGGPKRRLAPSSMQTARARTNPCAQCGGLASYALAAASPSSMAANTGKGWT